MPSPGMPMLHPDLPPAQPANPASAGESSDSPQSPPAEATPAQERLLAGKYRTVEELETAYGQSFEELDRIRQENRRALDEERRRVDALFSQRREPQGPAPVSDRMAEFGVSPDVFREAVREEARAIARAEIGQTLAPMTEGWRARQEIELTVPDFSKKEASIANFIRSDPSLTARYSRLYQNDPLTAMEWASFKYDETRPEAKHKEGGTRVSAAPPATDAGLPAGRAAGERTPARDPQVEEEAKGRRYYDYYKDPMPYVHARLKGVIPDSHFSE